jgi:microcystin-dependent protein
MIGPFLGTVNYFAFSFAPYGYVECIGQPIQVASSQALFALLGTIYGGNGTTFFNLPDLRGRTMVGAGDSATGSYRQGWSSGTETTKLTFNPMPAHTHAATIQIPVNTSGGDTIDPTQTYLCPGDDGPMFASAPTQAKVAQGLSANVEPAGSGNQFSVLSPYLALICCIATAGTFPSRG